jgi:oxygen-independent coproporphyrinogen-3 oxidase
MSGIYIHIPFCKQACHYCDFHFSTSMKLKGELINALLTELELRSDYLEEKKLSSIYFGGGTPSLLTQEELGAVFDKIQQLFSIKENAEITLEANPDDLTEEKLKMLQDTPVNRLSIGIQSFSDEDLQFMNRAHNSGEAHRCIERAQQYGFDNLTVDLIYGSPTTSDEQWIANIDRLFEYGIPHLSCYCLTVEARTALAHFVKTGKVSDVDDEQASRQFDILMEKMEAQGYEHYEISNFARPGRHAIHNSNYWRGEAYLGIGPSAHSYNRTSRQWNLPNNSKYIKGLKEGKVPFEKEELTPEQIYNEYVMTGLRTKWGVELDRIAPAFQQHFLQEASPYLADGKMEKKDNAFVLTRTGKHLADRIAMELFLS